MRTILISYDLVGTDEGSQDYKKLIAAIKALGAWANVNRSVWIVRTSKTAEAVSNELGQHMDANDRLFVIRVYREAAWVNTICTSEWLMDNLRD